MHKQGSRHDCRDDGVERDYDAHDERVYCIDSGGFRAANGKQEVIV
jgi:hypothetical protein